MSDYINFNGKLIAENKFAISPDNRSFRYGDGCFETMRVSEGNINLASFHFNRLFGSLKKMHFSIPLFMTAEEIAEQVSELVEKNNHSLARVRLTIFAGNGSLYDILPRHPGYIIQSWPLDTSVGQFNQNGLTVDIYEKAVKVADHFSMLKSNNFLPYVMAAIHAKELNLNDCLLLNSMGFIADSTIANVFVLSGDVLFTPPISDGPVDGIMRRYLLQCLRNEHYPIEEASIRPEQLAAASEIFLTNALSGIRWVGSFRNKKYEHTLSSTLHRHFIAPLFER